MLRNVTTVVAALLIAVAPCARAQSSRPQFEVASVRPNATGSFQIDFDASKGRFVAKNITAVILLQYAFDRQLSESELARGALLANASAIQIVGGPAWLRDQHFDIEAKPPGNSAIPQREMQLMMQSLLEDRFQLKAHREMRESPVYDLIVVKPGKMKISDQTSATAPPDRGRIGTLGSPRRSGLVFVMSGDAVTLSAFSASLQQWADRRIVDKTNLTGLFDVRLEFVPEPRSATGTASDSTPGVQQPASAPAGVSIFTALQEQLGLKLEGSKGPVEVLVIDSVSRPTEN